MDDQFINDEWSPEKDVERDRVERERDAAAEEMRICAAEIERLESEMRALEERERSDKRQALDELHDLEEGFIDDAIEFGKQIKESQALEFEFYRRSFEFEIEVMRSYVAARNVALDIWDRMSAYFYYRIFDWINLIFMSDSYKVLHAEGRHVVRSMHLHYIQQGFQDTGAERLERVSEVVRQIMVDREQRATEDFNDE